MRVMVLLKANKDSEEGKLPSEQDMAELMKFNQELMKASSPFQKFVGAMASGWLRAGRGRERDALADWETAARVPGIASANRGGARNRQAALLLRLGKPAAALAQLPPPRSVAGLWPTRLARCVSPIRSSAKCGAICSSG